MVSKDRGRHYPVRPRGGANPGRTQCRARRFAVAGRHDWMPLRPWLIGGFLMLVLLAGTRSAGAGMAGPATWTQGSPSSPEPALMLTPSGPLGMNICMRLPSLMTSSDTVRPAVPLRLASRSARPE